MNDPLLDPLIPVFVVTLGVLGLLVGSFLNVVIARVPHGLSIVHPRSRCPHCGHQLSWYENIPIFSWLALRGRCRSCGAAISARYVVVEGLTAVLYLACYQRFGWTWELLSAAILVSLLIPLTFIDLEHWLLPFQITIPGIIAGVALAFPMGMERFIDASIGAAVGFGAFWLLEVIGEKIFKKEALGGGDKFLLALIGAFLTWRGLLGVIFLSSLQGAIVGSLLLWIYGRAGPAPKEEPEHRKGEKDAPVVGKSGEVAEENEWKPGPTNLPFGPWLSLAALELLLIGPWLCHHLPATIGWIATGRLGCE